MKYFFLLASLIPLHLHAAGGRSLPAGESDPAVVEKAFSSSRGEVHFVILKGGHSAFLRTERGGIAGLKEVNGSAACDSWLISSKADAIPKGCEFVFHDEMAGGLYSVRSEEMEETGLFQAVRGTMRGAVVAL